jgi:hypothetical protein
LQTTATSATLERMSSSSWSATVATSTYAIPTVAASRLSLMMIGSAETVLGNVKKTRRADSSKRSERNAKKFYNRLVNVSSKERWRKRRVPRALEMMIETKRMRDLKWTSPQY